MLLASAFKFMATFRFEFEFYTNCTLMATFYTHGYTHSYLLLSWPHSGLHFMRTATLKVTFKTHGYTHGYILRSWLHFTPSSTYGYMRLHFRPFLLSDWRRVLHAYAHLCLRSWLHFTLMATLSATFYTHGYTHPWVHFALMVVRTVTLTITFTAYPLHDTFYRIAFTHRATRRPTFHTIGYTHGYILHSWPRLVPHFSIMATLTHGYILQ